MSHQRRESVLPTTGTFPILPAREIVAVVQELLGVRSQLSLNVPQFSQCTQKPVDPMIMSEPLDPVKIHDLYKDIVLAALDLPPGILSRSPSYSLPDMQRILKRL